MSATIESIAAASETPKPSKKRKVGSETPSRSKKKRKPTESEDDVTLQPTTLSSTSDMNVDQPRDSKEKKQKKDKKKVLLNLEDVETHSMPADAFTEAEEEQNNAIQDTQLGDDVLRPEEFAEVDESVFKSDAPSCFYSRRISLNIPIPAISQSSSISSLLSLHLSPLLLTYFPPAEGIVLSFSDPVLSANSENAVNLPLKPPRSGSIPHNSSTEILARCSDQYGVSWVWMTATFLVFRPQAGDEIKGWTNVQSEGFVGLVSYNYFQTAVAKTRIPQTWKWNGPTRDRERTRRIPKKGKLRDEDAEMLDYDVAASSQTTLVQDDQTLEDDLGCFVDDSGTAISKSQSYTVVDVEMVPGHEKDRWTLQIEGSLLSEEEERQVMAEEQQRFGTQHRGRSGSKSPGPEDRDIPLMSGGLGLV